LETQLDNRQAKFCGTRRAQAQSVKIVDQRNAHGIGTTWRHEKNGDTEYFIMRCRRWRAGRFHLPSDMYDGKVTYSFATFLNHGSGSRAAFARAEALREAVAA
jgi:hypothetical protein